MKDNKTTLFAQEFLKKLCGFSIATWISFFISFLSAPFTTRLFSPEVVGQNNMFSVYLTLSMLIAYLGVDQSYIRFYHEKEGVERNTLFHTSLGIALLMTCAIALGIFIFRDLISKEISGYENLFVPVCLIISLMGNVILRFFSLSYRMANQIIAYSILAVLITFIGKLFYLLVVFWEPSHYNVVIAITLGYVLISCTYLLLYCKTRKKIRLNVDRGMVALLLKFGLPLVPAAILSWLNNSIPQLMLNRYESYSAIGIYANAVAIAGIISLLQAGFNTYWIPFVYENYKQNAYKIRKVHHLITLSMIAFGFLIILSQDFIYLLLGENFRSSKIFFPFLLISPICYTIAETTGLGINISKKTYLNLWVFSCASLVNVLLCYWLLPVMGIIGAAISVCVSSVIMLILKTVIGEKYYKSIDCYWKTSVALLLIIVAAVINLILFDYVLLRYFSFIGLGAVLLVLYRREVKYLFVVLQDFIRLKLAL